MKVENIHIIINPASGQDQPILAALNRVLSQSTTSWSLSVTQKAGDAQAQAKDALTQGADVIAVYGGDGTVAAVASQLIDSETPLAVLPGGTANVFSRELGVPASLEQAIRLAIGENARVRPVDVGEINNHHFLLRLGLGFEAQMVADADRNLKDQLGFFAYVWSAAQNAVALQSAIYQITLDNKEVEVEAVTCGIANSGRMGIGFSISPLIRVDDGLLDVIAVRQADLPTIGQLLGNIMGLSTSVDTSGRTEIMRFMDSNSVLHWQAKEISIRTLPPQMVQYDGEILGKKDVQCRVLPQALQVVVPRYPL